MSTTSANSAAAIRARLDHPVIDADGHTVEFWPALAAYVAEEGVALDKRRPLASLGVLPEWGRLTTDQRAHHREFRPAWWAFPAEKTLDFATATIPGVLNSRLDELGIDFSVVYPSLGLVFLHLEEEENRRGACRALNRYHADVFQPYFDRVAPVAVIPMQTPQEALEELEYAVQHLGLRAVLLGSYAKRPVRAALERDPDAGRYAYWLDTFAVDSEFDYDPVWARCVELGVAPATHSIGQGWGSRCSISNYMHNHIGNFAASGEALCRALFLGGVTRRFPDLRVSFLEGGVAWARSLLNDLVGHWDKRNRIAVGRYDPARLDRAQFSRQLADHGPRLASLAARGASLDLAQETGDIDPSTTDEFAACEIERIEDIFDLFIPNFYFGCEADDRLVKLAYDSSLSQVDVRLNAMFGSDIGHWDVPDMSRVLGEAYEQVEYGHLAPEMFMDFVFGAAARFYLDANPAFFAGTVVEDETAKLFALRGADDPVARSCADPSSEVIR